MRTLTGREKVLALVGGGMLLLTFLILGFPSLSGGLQGWNERVMGAEKDLEEFERLKARYENLKGALAAGAVQTGNAPSLVMAMDRLAQQSRIAKSQLISMTPSSAPSGAEVPLEYVEVRLEGLTLKQLHDYLVGVESFKDKRIRTDRLQVKKRSDKPELLDAVVRVYALSSTRGG